VPTLTVRPVVAVVYEISQILNVGLDRQTVQILMALCEHGVNPEALAAVVRELRREAASIQVRPVSNASFPGCV